MNLLRGPGANLNPGLLLALFYPWCLCIILPLSNPQVHTAANEQTTHGSIIIFCSELHMYDRDIGDKLKEKQTYIVFVGVWPPEARRAASVCLDVGLWSSAGAFYSTRCSLMWCLMLIVENAVTAKAIGYDAHHLSFHHNLQ